MIEDTNIVQAVDEEYLTEIYSKDLKKVCDISNASVENAGELDGIKPALNVLYVGFNKKKKEIYLKQLTNDGLISVETYGLAEDKKEKTALDTVLDRITELERKLTNERNTANAGTEVPQRATSEPSTNATGQSNVAG